MAGEVVAHAAEVASHGGVDLVQVVALLGAGVIAVPLFRRLGLGSVLGYLAAGLAVGPFGLGLVGDPQAVLHAAEPMSVMQRTGSHLARVIGPDGLTQGVLFLEDVIEQLVGEIRDATQATGYRRLGQDQ